MRRPAAYSPSRRDRPVPGDAAPASVQAPAPPPPTSPVATPPRRRWGHGAAQGLAGVGLLLLGGALALQFARTPAQAITQEAIDAAVLRTLQETALPSPAAKAVALVAPSIVRVQGLGRDEPAPDPKNPAGRKPGSAAGSPPADGDPAPDASGADTRAYRNRGVGTGVVIVDKGVILTNLHVVQGAERIVVTFSDGSVSEASITGVQPENDLAVLQAHTIPDDLHAATMRSTADLRPGDQVAAVGFPFGIGPSASAGIVSGLKREFRSPEGQGMLSNLIQFDAAANPGNSGGPLVTMDGEVVGIVTAILNPTSARTFLGIGFAVPIENAAAAVGMHPF